MYDVNRWIQISSYVTQGDKDRDERVWSNQGTDINDCGTVESIGCQKLGTRIEALTLYLLYDDKTETHVDVSESIYLAAHADAHIIVRTDILGNVTELVSMTPK
jgi:hypothetical protein